MELIFFLMRLVKIFITIFFTFSFPILADTTELDSIYQQPLIEKAMDTYALYMHSEYVLSIIEKRYPDLKKHVLSIKERFNNNELYSSFNQIDIFLYKKKGKEWELLKETWKKSLENKKSLIGSKQDALKFIENQNKIIDEKTPFLKGILMFNPKYILYPDREFTDHWVYTFTSNRHHKSKEIEFSLELPLSYLSQESSRPNIIQKFINYSGLGLTVFVLQVKNDLNSEPERYLLEYIFKEKNIENIDAILLNKDLVKSFLPENMQYYYGESIVLDGQYGVKLCYLVSKKRLSYHLDIEGCTYIIPYRGKFILLLGTTTSKVNNQLIQGGLKKYERLFDLIANSLVIHSNYK